MQYLYFMNSLGYETYLSFCLVSSSFDEKKFNFVPICPKIPEEEILKLILTEKADMYRIFVEEFSSFIGACQNSKQPWLVNLIFFKRSALAKYVLNPENKK